MDSDDILIMIGSVIIVSILSFCGGVSMGMDMGTKKGAECILNGHKVTEDYLCVEIDKLRGINDEL